MGRWWQAVVVRREGSRGIVGLAAAQRPHVGVWGGRGAAGVMRYWWGDSQASVGWRDDRGVRFASVGECGAHKGKLQSKCCLGGSVASGKVPGRGHGSCHGGLCWHNTQALLLVMHLCASLQIEFCDNSSGRS